MRLSKVRDKVRRRFPDDTPAQHAAHCAIERRYAWNVEQRRKPVSKPHLVLQVRLRELERIFWDRYGGPPPDDDAGWGDLIVAAHTIAGLGGEVEAHIVAWAGVWAAWLPTGRAEQLAAHIAANPRKLKADTLAWRLRLSMADRTRLGITTIGAFDMGQEQRAAERKRKRRERERARRAAKSTGKPGGRPKKTPWPAGNKEKIDTPMVVTGFSPTTVAKHGEVATKSLATRETVVTGKPPRNRQRQPQARPIHAIGSFVLPPSPLRTRLAAFERWVKQHAPTDNVVPLRRRAAS